MSMIPRAISIEHHVESENLNIPELRDLIGEDVLITIRRRPRAMTKAEVEEFFSGIAGIEFDEKAMADLRERSE